MALMNCTKCSSQYEESDTEPYLCPICLEERRQIAAAIDAKLPHREQINPSIDERFAPYDLRNVLGRR